MIKMDTNDYCFKDMAGIIIKNKMVSLKKKGFYTDYIHEGRNVAISLRHLAFQVLLGVPTVGSLFLTLHFPPATFHISASILSLPVSNFPHQLPLVLTHSDVASGSPKHCWVSRAPHTTQPKLS